MSTTRYLTGAALALLTMATWAQSPFQINGLHTDLVFTDAQARIAALGGKCRVKPARTEGGGVSAQCAMPAAGESSATASGAEPGAPVSTPYIGTQPITRIGIEAPDESAQLTRIVFVFEGGLESVADYLAQHYGPPDHLPSTEESWSHSRRRGWARGIYSMGLLNSPDLVILTVIRPAAGTGAN